MKKLTKTQKEQLELVMLTAGLKQETVNDYFKYNIIAGDELMPEHIDIIEEVEANYNCVVYCAHYTPEVFLNLYIHFLDEEFEGDFEQRLEDIKHKLTYAYVYNIIQPDFSEAGMIGFICVNNHLVRVQ